MIKLMDAVIGTVSDKVDISVQINKTKHAVNDKHDTITRKYLKRI